MKITKQKIFIAFILTLSILFQTITPRAIYATNVYDGGVVANEVYSISWQLSECWDDEVMVEVTIGNNTDAPIDNWAVTFSMSGAIEEIWERMFAQK